MLTRREAVLKHLDENNRQAASMTFGYHHLPNVSFMTFRVNETVRSTGEHREQRGIDYTFEGGKIATKDVYRKPIIA